ncbi:hypothetical protein [Nocardioides sp. AE5]|uniref:hypothetical protein n=1 Tax=Nocardioides sp. AE5 TaxID=2962573 RepID=UPI0028815FC5|nr:hypothetical protein [Nocardioides sp. AE5]MDT0203235.1 hypothetical protein [Nocardioides sp. AE5]
MLTDDPVWGPWSSEAMALALNSGPVILNPLVYAEVSVGFAHIEDLDAALPDNAFVRGTPAVVGRIRRWQGVPALPT